MTEASSHKGLRGPRSSRNARAANREREAVSGGDPVLICGFRGKNDAVNFGVRRNRDIGRIGKKIAIFAGPLGIPFGVQFAAVFQSPEMGSRSHWALIA